MLKFRNFNKMPLPWELEVTLKLNLKHIWSFAPGMKYLASQLQEKHFAVLPLGPRSQNEQKLVKL